MCSWLRRGRLAFKLLRQPFLGWGLGVSELIEKMGDYTYRWFVVRVTCEKSI